MSTSTFHDYSRCKNDKDCTFMHVNSDLLTGNKCVRIPSTKKNIKDSSKKEPKRIKSTKTRIIKA